MFEPEAEMLRPRVAEKMMDTTTRPENWNSDIEKNRGGTQ